VNDRPRRIPAPVSVCEFGGGAMILFDPEAMLAPLSARAAALQAAGAPGAVVEVVRGGRSASVASGEADIHTGEAARPDNTFEVGSQTKMMTAVAVLQLADEGLVDLDARAADYLPAATVAGLANAGTATVRQLLQMRSGVPSYLDAEDASGTPLYVRWMQDHPDEVFGPEEALEIARNLPAGAPGSFHYSNTDFLLLGLLIEAVTGEAWADVLEERVFDPAGMDSTSARQMAADPDRWSSYRQSDGEYVDVTHARWDPRGETGVVSTTGDLIAFLDALLVDRTLLSAAALAEMRSYVNLFGNNTNQFGLGIFQQRDSGGTFQGFAGGTLGTGTATYHGNSGIILSAAANASGVGVGDVVKQLDQAIRGLAAWAPVDDDGGAIEIRSVSAADLSLGQSATGGVRLEVGGASLELVRGLRQMDAAATTFADGSVLVIGDGIATTHDDDGANVVSINRHFTAASGADNRLIGLGGDDTLTGGGGADRVEGGAGDDTLAGLTRGDTLAGGDGNDRLAGGWGNDRLEGGGWSNDRLEGGAGDDRLLGGAGVDALAGGGGRDDFVFQTGDSRPDRPDTILDLEAIDRINLRQIDAMDGGRWNNAFHWVGADPFSGARGELRYVTADSDLRVEGDTDGDGRADLAITVAGLDMLSDDVFLL
jgi:D-alanyl-D-alanine carboxypeptidase